MTFENKEINNYKIREKNEYQNYNFDKKRINEINILTKNSSLSHSKITCRDWKDNSSKDNDYHDGSWSIAIGSF